MEDNNDDKRTLSVTTLMSLYKNDNKNRMYTYKFEGVHSKNSEEEIMHVYNMYKYYVFSVVYMVACECMDIESV